MARTKERPKRSEWLEAVIVSEPVKPADLKEPLVLVERRTSSLLGANGEPLDAIPGFPVISLFTGAGGFDLGVEAAGFTCVVQVEWDWAACDTLLMNRPEFYRYAALIQADIAKLETWEILREAGLYVGEAYMLIGGPPCQGFSTSGKRVVGDERNDLVFEYLRIVREAQPRFFIFENVPGFMTLGDGVYFERFLKTAYECGYELVYGLANAVEYGVPQGRCRFICMGSRRDVAHIDGVIAALPSPHCFSKRDLGVIRAAEAETLFGTEEACLLQQAPGVRYFPDRPVLRPPNPIRGRDPSEDGRSKTFLEFYRKLLADEPDRIVMNPTEA